MDYRAFDALPGYICILNSSLEYIYCNDEYYRFFQLEKNKIIEKKPKNILEGILTPEAIDGFYAVIQEAISTQMKQVYEQTIHWHNKKITWTIQIKPYYNEENVILGVLMNALDTTDHKNMIEHMVAENAITEFTLNSLLEHAPGHIYWLDTHNIYKGCNRNQAITAGLQSRHDIVGKTNYDLPWFSDAYTLNAINQNIMLTGNGVVVEEKIRHLDGSDGIYLSHKVPIVNNNTIIGMMGISIDVTERKMMEVELIKTREMAQDAQLAKKEFLENIRHDIRTPLYGIIGCADLLANGYFSDLAIIRDYSNKLLACSSELLNFLNSILESINVSSGDVPLIVRKFSLLDIIEKVITLSQPFILVKKLAIDYAMDECIATHFVGDDARLYRIISELVNNAVKFTHQGHIHIQAMLVADEEFKQTVCIQISDTGMGIPEDKQHDLFLRFNRLIPSYKGICEGSGLGLSIIKRFIDDLHAEITVESTVNEGSTFHITIPLRKKLQDIHVP